MSILRVEPAEKVSKVGFYVLNGAGQVVVFRLNY